MKKVKANFSTNKSKVMKTKYKNVSQEEVAVNGRYVAQFLLHEG
jgi:hypothetical protein